MHKLHICWGCHERAEGDKAAEKDERPGVWVALEANPQATTNPGAWP